MPQQRRKLHFSGKKKKDQIGNKRLEKSSQKYLRTRDDNEDDTTEDSELPERKLMQQPLSRGGASGSAAAAGGAASRNKNHNRYNLQFYQETKKDLEQIKLEGYKPLQTTELTAQQREIDASHFDGYDFPVRPEWSYNMAKEALDRSENRYFREYVDELQKLHKNEHKDLSLFELNLETWRQLWRVLEISDILLIIVDVRYATLMFPPALYKHIVNTLKKRAILVLNKVDLVAADVVVAWRHYFHTTYPGMPVVLFASYSAKALKGTVRGRLGHKRSMEGVYNIFRECQKIAQTEVDLTAWEQKILEDLRADNISVEDETDNDDGDEDDLTPPQSSKCAGESPHPCDQQSQELYRNGMLTVGCIGFPNVGKSSLINALKGRKVVSVSRTPGHTKHFQTIFLTNTVRLCDCPGLVFPTSTPKQLQVLLGSYPISQLQVPFRSLKLLSEHLKLPELLRLRLPEDYDVWSAAAVADAWALKRGFLTAKAARPDRFRAANHLLRMCLGGQLQLVLQFYPPNYFAEQEKWQCHSEVDEVKKYQNTQCDEKYDYDDVSSVNSESVGSDDDASNSNDETNADEEEDAAQKPSKSRNTFALLEDD